MLFTMKVHYYLPIVALALFIGACKGKASKQEEEEADSMEVVGEDTVLSTETVNTFNTLAFSTFAKKKTPAFDWKKFRMTGSWVADSLRITTFAPSPTYFASYGKLIKYSPDSSMFVDLDSYSFDVRKDSSGKLRGTDMGTDTEISLVIPSQNKKERLLFFGPGSSVDDAYWLDKDHLILIGVQDHGGDTGKTAALWKYNVPEKTFYLYEWKDNDATITLFSNWRKERLQAAMQ